MDILLSEENGLVDLQQGVGRLINAIVAVLGPELSPGSIFFSRCKVQFLTLYHLAKCSAFFIISADEIVKSKSSAYFSFSFPSPIIITATFSRSYICQSVITEISSWQETATALE